MPKGVSTHALLQELKQGLRLVYGPNLKGVYVYGSRVRGEERPESDLDVAIVLGDFADYWAEVRRTSELISDLSLKYEVSISPVRLRELDWIRGDSPFLNSVRRESTQA